MTTSVELPQGPPAGDIDPVTFEVVRNKLRAITEEQAITLKSVSGSPVVTDATDFNNGIYLSDGSIVTMGPQVLFHTGTMSTVIKSIVAEFSDNPGIAEGDMFILNDPYRGAVHQHDISIVAPIFWEGERVAWAGSCAHQLDVGGMNFGSWSVKATEVQQEAMLLPGLKIVEGGEIRHDVWQLVMGMTRLPLILGLDLKAMIAANNVAIRRFQEIAGRYGIGVVDGVMRTEIDLSERRLRARLRSLPDGTFRAVDYIDHDGHENRLYEIRVAVEKRGDQLTFDMTGSSPQAPGFINCTEAGLVGALFTAILPILAPDIRWNQGLLRPVEIVSPPGLVCNAEFPAPVSSATVAAMWVVASVANSALSRLAACAGPTRREASAVSKGSIQIVTLGGLDRDGSPYGTLLLDATAGGGGAYEDHDGLDAAGDYCVPRPTITNVESNESNGPLLYLYRRLVPDTSGAGRMRGGSAMGLALTPHDTPGLDAMLITHGVEVPNSTGQFGGLEASCNDNGLMSGAGDDLVGSVNGPESLAAEGDVRQLGSKPGFFPLGAGDVFTYTFQGGGGYGDPIERDPEAVRRDVADEAVTSGFAEKIYGVVLGAGGEVDAGATEARRIAIRTERLGGEPARAPGTGFSHSAVVEIGHALALTADGVVECRCGHDLGPARGNWKDGALSRTVEPHEHGPRLRLHEELEMREHMCPGCGTLLESEVARKGAPHIFSIELG
jgi:N-methylhydantoinase B